MYFFVKQYIDCQKQPVGGAFKVLAKFLKTVFDEGHFIVNLLYQISIKKRGDDLGHYLKCDVLKVLKL